MKKFIALVLLAWTINSAAAQNVTVIGPVTPGNVPSFNSTTVIKDSGIPFGSVVQGPASSTVGHLATWANTTGTLLADTSVGTGLAISGGSLNISNQITAAGPIGGPLTVPVITFNAQGQLTAVTTATISSRTVLSGNTTYYYSPGVSATPNCNGATGGAAGSDTTGNGTLARPWQTAQKAQNVINQTIDLAGFQATIVQCDGTMTTATNTLNINGPYTGASPPPSDYPQPDTCPVLWRGNNTTPANTVITSTSADAILVADGAYVCFQDLTLSVTGGSGSGLQLGGSTVVLAGNLFFTGATRSGIYSGNNSVFENYSIINFQGTFISPLEASVGSNVNIFSGIALSGNVTATQFALADSKGLIKFNNNTITLNGHTVTGLKFAATNGSTILTGANDTTFTYLPGTGYTIGFASTYDDQGQSTVGPFVNYTASASVPAALAGTTARFRNSNTNSTFIVGEASGTGTNVSFIGRTSRGTAASPTAIQSADIMNTFAGYGYGATGFNGSNSNGGITVAASQNFTDAAQGTQLDFYVTPNGSIIETKGWSMLNGGTLASQASLNGIGVTSTDGIVLQNLTAAAAGAQQWSPRFRFTGQGWKTAATAASQQVDWIAELQTVQGSSAPTSNLVISGQVNGGGYVTIASILSTGIVNPVTGFQVNGAATSGNVLRGNGTNFVSAQLACADLSAPCAVASRLINTTAPITGGGDLTADRTIACATCATTTNGGALSATAPIAISAAGVISISAPWNVTTLTLNGVLYGNGAGTVQVTAQGGANTVFVANAGAPSFTAAPTIGTSVTTPILIGGTASGSTAEIRSTSGTGSGDKVFITGGTNGGTTLATFLGSSGIIGLGTTAGATSPSTASLVTISANTATQSGTQAGTTTYFHLVSADSVLGGMEFDGFGNFPFFGFRRAQGTAASKTAAVSGITGNVAALAYDGAVYHTNANIIFNSTETQSASAFGSQIQFTTCVNGTTCTGANQTSYYLQNDGSLAIGINTTGAGSGGLLVNGQIYAANLTQTSAAQTGTLCWSSGSSPAGKFTVDTTLGCLSSSARWKQNIEPFRGSALNELSALRPVTFEWRDPIGDGQKGRQIGLVAEDVWATDHRLGGLGSDGLPRGWRQDVMIVMLIKATQEMKAVNDNLRTEIDDIKRRIAR